MKTKKYKYTQTYNTITELSQSMEEYYKGNDEEAVFVIKDLLMPFDLTNRKYESSKQGEARITYKGEKQKVEYYKCLGNYELDRIEYNKLYGKENTIYLNDVKIRMRGKGEGYTWASWSDGQYVYALIFQYSVTQDDIKNLVEQTIIERKETNTFETYNNETDMKIVLGFNIDDIIALKDHAKSTKLQIYGNRMAAIVYGNIAGSPEVKVFKSKKTYDMYEHYFKDKLSYQFINCIEKTEDVEGQTITLHLQFDRDGSYFNACWSTDKYNYVVSGDKLMMKDNLLNVVKMILEQDK